MPDFNFNSMHNRHSQDHWNMEHAEPDIRASSATRQSQIQFYCGNQGFSGQQTVLKVNYYYYILITLYYNQRKPTHFSRFCLASARSSSLLRTSSLA